MVRCCKEEKRRIRTNYIPVNTVKVSCPHCMIDIYTTHDADCAHILNTHINKHCYHAPVEITLSPKDIMHEIPVTGMNQGL